MSTPVYVPEWVLGDIKRDYRIGDHVDWPVSHLDRQDVHEEYGVFGSVAMKYEWEEEAGTLSGTVIRIQAMALKYDADGRPKPNSMTVWPVRTTETNRDGDTSVDAFIFEIETGPHTA
jgi:hypothetical protein